MKIFLDTNVLVAAVCGGHTHHKRAFPLLERVQEKEDEGFVSAHSLAEMYAILTKLPVPFRHTAEQALLSIEENVLKYFHVGVLTATDYAAILRESAVTGIEGGMIYDALMLKSACKADVQRVFTFNLKHFHSIASKSMKALIESP